MNTTNLVRVLNHDKADSLFYARIRLSRLIRVEVIGHGTDIPKEPLFHTLLRFSMKKINDKIAKEPKETLPLLPCDTPPGLSF